MSHLNDKLVVERVPPIGGTQRIYRFDNGFGASVVDNQYSRGTELAVLHFLSDDNLDFELTYSTPVTDDVIGYIASEVELVSILQAIEALPPAGDDHCIGLAGGNPLEALRDLAKMVSNLDLGKLD